MSWQEQIEQEMIIITGDGNTYKPFWRNAKKAVEYNVSEFEFVGIEGALIDRRLAKARRFELELFFVGENNIDQAKAFEISAKDSRPWTINHPIYGEIVCQPFGLQFDDSNLNVTQITANLVETITQDTPRGSTDPIDKIEEDSETATESLANNYANNVVPDSEDINQMTETNSQLYNDGKKIANQGEEFDNYFNAFNSANSAIINATQEPLEAMQKIQAVINAPALFAESVKSRINTLVTQFNKLRALVPDLSKKSQKIFFETSGGSLTIALVKAVSNPQEGDYENAPDVLFSIDSLLNAYNSFLQDLDFLQDANGGNGDFYIPSYEPLNELASLVDFTVSNLFDLAIGAKKERSIILEADTNVINLAHRLYGLIEDDSTIDNIIKENNIGLTEFLNIKKGRKIIYYIG